MTYNYHHLRSQALTLRDRLHVEANRRGVSPERRRRILDRTLTMAIRRLGRRHAAAYTAREGQP